MAPRVCAQDDSDSTPLGDVARSYRKKPTITDSVIDNDNFSKVMDEVEKARAAGVSAIFSFDPGTASARSASPDVQCSLSFSAKSSPQSDPAMLNDLPRSEIDKLEGPATLDGDSLQVTVHNGSAWELREVVIGLTIVRNSVSGNSASYYANPGYASPSYRNSGYGNVRMLPAVAGRTDGSQDASQKQADITILLHVKGSAAPAATAVFRASLNFALFPDQEWHWAIMKAKGIPPQVSTENWTKDVEQPATNSGLAGSPEVSASTSQTITSNEQPLRNESQPLPNPLQLNLPTNHSGVPVSLPRR